MKKYLFSLIFLFVSFVGFSQKGLSYQAVILDPTPIEIPGQDIAGQPLVNGDVWLKFSIYNGTLMQFEEIQKTKTDGYGLVNLLIGSVASASFNSLTWDGVQKSMQVFVSFNQGASYTKVSDQKLYYNPYALYAETAGKLGSVLAIADGGTGATTAADARANLGLGNIDNTSDATKPISTATKAALDLKANVADVNAGLNLKATVAALEAHMAITADTTMLATKAALTDLNSYAPKASPTFTGTVSGINKSMVGLGSVDNTSDEAKPISIATQTALNLKENTANKSTNVVTDGSSDTKYPSVKSVKNYVDAQVASGIGSATISDADATTKGKIQLAGDLSGTAAAPTVPGLALKAPKASPTFTGTVTTGAISATSISASLYSSQPKTLEYSGTTINWNPAQGLNAAITLTANSALAFTSTPPTGSYGTIVLTQDGTGSRTITLPSITGVTNKILGSTSTSTVELSTAANAKDILNFYYDGIECYWNIGQGYGAAATTTSASTNLASGVSGTLAVANGGTGSSTKNFVDLTSDQTIAGSKVFSSSISANGVYVGKGSGNNGNNVALGGGTLGSGTGERNTAIGYAALNKYSGSSFDGNTAVGYYNLVNLTSGQGNTSVGGEAMMGVTSGMENTSIGVHSLINANGNDNVGVGKSAGQTITSGSQNTIIGKSADVGTNNLYNASALGYGAIVTSSNAIQLGNTSINNVKTSGTLTAGGVTYPNVHGSANQVLTTSGSGTLGWSTPITSLTTTGSGSATISGTTLNIPAGIPYSGATGSVDFGAYDVKVNGLTIGIGAGTLSNTVMGNSALASNTTGNNNNALGYNALLYNTTGSNNNAIGSNSLVNNTTGNNNNALGYYALNRNSTGINNTAVGQSALEKNTTGSNNNAFGFYSLNSNSTGWYNTGFGGNTLYGNTTGRYNTAIGRWALYHNSTGNHNTAIGNYAGVAPGSSNLENTTAIGDSALVTTSNTIQLGNPSVTNVKTAGNITAGSVIYPNAHNSTAGQVLTINASGTATWTTQTSGSSSTHSIGEVYGGGIVFYVWDGGAHGLIAPFNTISRQSTNPLPPIVESQIALNANLSGVTANGLLAGKSNTLLIIANQGSGLYAASYCYNYLNSASKTFNSVSYTFPLYNDWYLPSIYEINLFRSYVWNNHPSRGTYVNYGNNVIYYNGASGNGNDYAWGKYLSSTMTGTRYKLYYLESGNEDGSTAYNGWTESDRLVVMPIRSF